MAINSTIARNEKTVRPRRVAVIGAGVSGIVTAKWLRSSGLNVVIYERSKEAGGNWLYDERKPPEPTYPSLKPSQADFIPTSVLESHGENERLRREQRLISEEEELAFAPPGPAYSGLTNNVPTTLQSLKDFPWPHGTPDFVNVREKKKYIESYSQAFHIASLIKYNTRVERLCKVADKWELTSRTLIKDNTGACTDVYATEHFDLVVVASGHYHAARVPDITGLKEWKSAWPDKVQHSKRYRTPTEFKDQTVLLIGAGVSSTDIARECTPFAKKIYQSSRGGRFDLPPTFLPEGAERVAGVSSFEMPGKNQTATVNLVDGTILEGIDRIIIATGYLMTLPFLPDHQDDLMPVEDANDQVLVTDGSQYHNLHKDIFYIPDTTLAFVGVPAYSATFTFFEYQAIAVDAVFSQRAKLPSTSQMRAEYQDKVKAKGFGRAFHSVRDEEVEYVKDLVCFVNSNIKPGSGRRIEAHTEAWIAERKLLSLKLKDRFESTRKDA